jgi:hypothetical protein
LNNGDETMKKIIIAVLIMAFIPISYAGAEEKGTFYAVNAKTSMSSEGYLPLPAKYENYYYKEGVTKETKKADFLNCIEGQRRIVSYGRMGIRNEETKPYRGYNSTVWITIQCMKNKGYVETKHKIFEYPHPD